MRLTLVAVGLCVTLLTVLPALVSGGAVTYYLHDYEGTGVWQNCNSGTARDYMSSSLPQGSYVEGFLDQTGFGSGHSFYLVPCGTGIYGAGTWTAWIWVEGPSSVTQIGWSMWTASCTEPCNLITCCGVGIYSHGFAGSSKPFLLRIELDADAFTLGPGETMHIEFFAYPDNQLKLCWDGVECASCIMFGDPCSFDGGENLNAKVAVHVLPHSGSRSCASGMPQIQDCQDIITTQPGWNVDAFPVFFDLYEYRGFEYSLCWPGLYSCTFNDCSHLSIGQIIESGDEIAQTWFSCMPYSVAIPGWAWIYDWGMICVGPSMYNPDVIVLDCECDINMPKCNFCAGIGGFVGDDPCTPTGAEESTWGEIKMMFR
jgi:hypothetical protein